MPVTVKNYAGNICKDNPRLFNILQVSFLKEKADFLKKDIPFPTKEKNCLLYTSDAADEL